MKTLVNSILFLGGILLLSACHSLQYADEITPQELNHIKAEYMAISLPRMVYYMGSDDENDYFYIDIPLDWNSIRKAKRPNEMIDNRFPVTRKKSHWRFLETKIDTFLIWNESGFETVTVDELTQPFYSKYLDQKKSYGFQLNTEK